MMDTAAPSDLTHQPVSVSPINQCLQNSPGPVRRVLSFETELKVLSSFAQQGQARQLSIDNQSWRPRRTSAAIAHCNPRIHENTDARSPALAKAPTPAAANIGRGMMFRTIRRAAPFPRILHMRDEARSRLTSALTAPSGWESSSASTCSGGVSSATVKSCSTDAQLTWRRHGEFRTARRAPVPSPLSRCEAKHRGPPPRPLQSSRRRNGTRRLERVADFFSRARRVRGRARSAVAVRIYRTYLVIERDHFCA